VDDFATITCEIAGPVATVTLTRPDARNALSGAMVDELLRCFTTLAGEEHAGVRVAVLRAAGTAFCAGGDVRDLGDATHESAAVNFEKLMRALNEAPQVVVARIQGPAMGGGLGLVCATDIAIAAESASFALPEVRMGLAPALIMPYVLQRIGFTRARQLMLTGLRFGAEAARGYGLVHDTCADAELDTVVAGVVREVLRCAPQALRACKRLLFSVAAHLDPAATLGERVETLNRLRASDEAAQGIAAFLQKRPAPWASESSQPSSQPDRPHP
jgi:enoyl-CoA hydratase/carnithine racemase